MLAGKTLSQGATTLGLTRKGLMLTLLLGLVGFVGGDGAPVTPTPNGILLDVFNMDVWQALGLGAILLALSPVPWIGALSAGRLLFRADLERQLAERDKVHARELAEKDRNHENILAERATAYALTEKALATEQERNARLTDALSDSTEALQVTNHALIEFNEVAKRATV